MLNYLTSFEEIKKSNKKIYELFFGDEKLLKAAEEIRKKFQINKLLTAYVSQYNPLRIEGILSANQEKIQFMYISTLKLENITDELMKNLTIGKADESGIISGIRTKYKSYDTINMKKDDKTILIMSTETMTALKKEIKKEAKYYSELIMKNKINSMRLNSEYDVVKYLHAELNFKNTISQ